MKLFKKMSPGRFLVLGFLFVIFLGSILLALPISHEHDMNVSYIDALFTATSAVCVTGLITVETADTYNLLGEAIIAILIQIGGLGVASVGVGFIMLTRRTIGFKDRVILKEALNLSSVRGVVKLVKAVLLMTLTFEAVGAILSYLVFSKDYEPMQAVKISIFHAISSFNNAGFDLLGGFKSLVEYHDNILLIFTTSGLIIFGGLGFIVIKEILLKHSFKKFSLHTKIVITVTFILLVSGTILFKLIEGVDWLGAFFNSTTARTAGFATHPLDKFSNAGLFVFIIFMFIGASPGSTGGGIKTTTAFTLIKSAYSVSTNKYCTAFKRRIPMEIVNKAFIIAFLGVLVIFTDTLIITILEPDFSFIQILFEVVSAFGTVGLSTGITPSLSTASKVVIIITMFIGRLGPLTMATIWYFKPASSISYSEETYTIG